MLWVGRGLVLRAPELMREEIGAEELTREELPREEEGVEELEAGARWGEMIVAGDLSTFTLTVRRR